MAYVSSAFRSNILLVIYTCVNRTFSDYLVRVTKILTFHEHPEESSHVKIFCNHKETTRYYFSLKYEFNI